MIIAHDIVDETEYLSPEGSSILFIFVPFIKYVEFVCLVFRT